MPNKGMVGSGISPTLGNGIAYFGLWYASYKYGITFDDPELALLFAGGIAGSLLLEMRRVFAGIAFVLTKIWADKHDSNTGSTGDGT